MLRIANVTKTYAGPEGSVRALVDLTLTVKPGGFVAVQGPSGSGKTTLLMAAGGLLAPDAGQVLVGGEDPYALSAEKRARFRGATIGFVFQQFHLVPYLTVLENVLSPCLAVPTPDAPPRAEALLERFGLTRRRHHVPAALSTGEQQRTALARALLNRPKLLLADEPTGNLDDASAHVVLDALAEFARDGGAVLLVTHHTSAAEHAKARVYLRGGELQAADQTGPEGPDEARDRTGPEGPG